MIFFNSFPMFCFNDLKSFFCSKNKVSVKIVVEYFHSFLRFMRLIKSRTNIHFAFKIANKPYFFLKK
jgi:hypothetical protein